MPSIDPIDDSLWPDIQRLQAEVYHQVEPENTETLRSKWLASPASCFVARQGEAVLAYLLAHGWDSEAPPKLFQPIEPATEGRFLFLHDLAVSTRASGLGVGRKMVDRLLAVARQRRFSQIRLVAVQGSVPFWQKMGFEPVPGVRPSRSYGDDATLMQHTVPAAA
jgi:GNAT superfamily N-acetyltransferase